MTTKTVDSKGRLTLDKRFANQTVIVEELNECEVIVKLARVIPERELWLWQNPTALGMVLKGLEEATRREFVPGPDLDADAAHFAD